MPRRRKPAVSPKEEALQGRILERPDGFYWDSRESKELRGPFESRAEAEADMLAGGATEEEFEGNDTLQEAESELGISEWIDPDTGGPAEDNVPRIEDH
ncbi:MAG TPA: hypothetical protein VFB93_17785 [Burkholderiales bacterium]|nr:hypothetical protein [Burkholderiales bacterium]